MDFGSPVAQNVNVNPQQGIQTLSALLNLQQQKQQLQTETAQAYQATQSAAERQRLAQIPWKSFQNPDGSFDMDKVSSAALSVAPTTGQDFIQRFAQMAQGGAATKKAYYSLNQEYQNNTRAALGSWAGDPDSDTTALAKQRDIAVENAPASSKDAVQQVWDHTLRVISSPDLITGQPKTLQQQKQAALLYSRAGLSPEGVSGPGGLSTPQAGMVNTGSQIIPTTTVPQTGVTRAANAPPVANVQLAPSQQPGYLQIAAAAGGAGQVDVQRFNGITNAAATAQTGVALADQVAELAKEVRTGELSQEWANKLTVLQQSDPSITARQMLAKYAAQLKTTATAGAATDAERSQIDAGMPSPETMNPDAVRKAAQYLHGYFRMNQARGLNAMQHVASQGTPAGLTQADTQFMQSKDPFVYSFRDMSPQQQREFLIERYGPGGSKDPQGFAQFERRVKGEQ